MREIRKSGSMSGERKRSDAVWPKPPRLSSTLLRRWFQQPSRDYSRPARDASETSGIGRVYGGFGDGFLDRVGG
jgi:hypothetical protein